MAKFSVNLYFPKSLSKEEALRRLQALPNQGSNANGPEIGSSGNVSWQIGTIDHQYTADRIRQYLGMPVGDYSVRLTVTNPSDDDMLEKWDRIVDLLEYGDDTVALYELAEVLLVQKDRKLSLDTQSGYQSDIFREHVRKRRPAEAKPLGCLEELDRGRS